MDLDFSSGLSRRVRNMSVIIPPLGKVDLRGPVSWAAHSSWSQSRPWYIVDISLKER